MNIFDFALDEEDMKELGDLEVGPSARICDFLIFEGWDFFLLTYNVYYTYWRYIDVKIP